MSLPEFGGLLISEVRFILIHHLYNMDLMYACRLSSCIYFIYHDLDFAPAK